MSFVTVSLDKVRSSLGESATHCSGTDPSTNAYDAAADCLDTDQILSPSRRPAGGRASSFFSSGSSNTSEGRVSSLTPSSVERGQPKSSSTVTNVVDVCFESLLKRALPSNISANNDAAPRSGGADIEGSIEYDIEILAARAAALASAGLKGGNKAVETKFAPPSPDTVAAALTRRNMMHGTSSSGSNDCFGLDAISSGYCVHDTPSNVADGIPINNRQLLTRLWNEKECIQLKENPSRANVEEQVRSLCSQLMHNREMNDDNGAECNNDDKTQQHVWKDMLHLLVLLSDSTTSTQSVGHKTEVSTSGEILVHGSISSEQSPPSSGFETSKDTPTSFYCIENISPSNSGYFPVYNEHDVISWSLLAMCGLPSPLYSIVDVKEYAKFNRKVLWRPFQMHGIADSTSLFDVTSEFADIGSNYLYLDYLRSAQADTTASSSFSYAWKACVHRIEHWLESYRCIVMDMKNDIECDATSLHACNLLGLQAETKTLRRQLSTLSALARRLQQQQDADNECHLLDSVYEMIEFEQLLISTEDNDEPALWLLWDLFVEVSKGALERIYRSIHFGSSSFLGGSADTSSSISFGNSHAAVIQLPLFLKDLSGQITRTMSYLDLIRTSDYALYCRMVEFHLAVARKGDAGSTTMSFFRIARTQEDADQISMVQDDIIAQYKEFISLRTVFGTPRDVSACKSEKGRGAEHQVCPNTDSSDDVGEDTASHTSTALSFPKDTAASVWLPTIDRANIESLWADVEEDGLMDVPCLEKKYPEVVAGCFFGDVSSMDSTTSTSSPRSPDKCLTLRDKSQAPPSRICDGVLPIDEAIELSFRRYIERHCELTERFMLLFFLRKSELIQNLVLVRRVFLGYGCYLKRFTAHCFEMTNSNTRINKAVVHRAHQVCFIATPREAELFASIKLDYSILAQDMASIAPLCKDIKSGSPAMQMPSPVSSIIDENAVVKYRVLRSFILRHLFVEEQMKQAWKSLARFDRRRRGDISGRQTTLKYLHVMCYELCLSFAALSQYIKLTLQASWQNFLNALPLDPSNGFSGLQHIYELHQINLDELLASCFQDDDDVALARVRQNLNEFYVITSSLFAELIALATTNGDAPEDMESSSLLSRLWKRYCQNKPTFHRSLRMASSSNPFCRDLLQMLTNK